MNAALPLPMFEWVMSGATARGVVEGDSDPDVFLPELIAHHRAGRLPFDKLVKTHPFDRINRAIEDANSSGKSIKVVLTF